MASPAGIVFPCEGKVPKAAIFLRCQVSHVYTAPALSAGSYTTVASVAQVFGACLKCPLTSMYPHAIASHNCPFCTHEMTLLSDSTRKCCNEVCWFAHTVTETGTNTATSVWAKLYREMGNYILYSNEEQTTRFDVALRSLPVEDVEAAKSLVDMSQGRVNNGQ